MGERYAAVGIYLGGLRETARLEIERRRAVKEATVFAAGDKQQACTKAEELLKSSIKKLNNLTSKGGSLLLEFRRRDRLR